MLGAAGGRVAAGAGGRSTRGGGMGGETVQPHCRLCGGQ